jgi:hypothetical protein
LRGNGEDAKVKDESWHYIVEHVPSALGPSCFLPSGEEKVVLKRFRYAQNSSLPQRTVPLSSVHPVLAELQILELLFGQPVINASVLLDPETALDPPPA